jgi:hypothetical protein
VIYINTVPHQASRWDIEDADARSPPLPSVKQ